MYEIFHQLFKNLFSKKKCVHILFQIQILKIKKKFQKKKFNILKKKKVSKKLF